MAKEGLGFARFILVLSSLSPLFILWALRGAKDVPDCYWVPGCLLLFVLPNIFLFYMLRKAKKTQNKKTIKVASSRDQREHLLVYLFAMLIPLYDVNLGGYRELLSVAVAFFFVVFIFWHMKLHYMNVFLAMFGYHIFTVQTVSGIAGEGDSPSSNTYAVISKKDCIEAGEIITGFRLGGNVLVDAENDGKRI
jgi:hypothetical protein